MEEAAPEMSLIELSDDDIEVVWEYITYDK